MPESGKDKILEEWKAFAERHGGRYLSDELSFSDDAFGKVEVPYKAWKVTIDIDIFRHSVAYVEYFTRLRVPFVNPERFRLKIYQEGFRSEIGKIFGMQDIVLGYPEFDDTFIIQGSDPEKLKELFSDEELRSKLLTDRGFVLSVLKNEGFFRRSGAERVDVIEYEFFGIAENGAMLEAHYELMGTILDRMCALGATIEQAPAKEF